MIPRPKHLRELKGLLKSYPVVGIIGPRQIGKTTLAKQVAKQHKGATTHFDLEDARDLARLSDPELTLEPLRGLVILDEIQRLFVIHAGEHSFDMAKKIRAIALPHLLDELKPW